MSVWTFCPACRQSVERPLEQAAWANLHVPLDLAPFVEAVLAAVAEGQPDAALLAFLPLLRRANLAAREAP